MGAERNLIETMDSFNNYMYYSTPYTDRMKVLTQPLQYSLRGSHHCHRAEVAIAESKERDKEHGEDVAFEGHREGSLAVHRHIAQQEERNEA